MDDINQLTAHTQAELDAMDEEDRAQDDLSDGIDWDEITATTQADWDAGRFAFDSAHYPTEEAADAAMYAMLRSIEEKIYEEISAAAMDAPSP
ncbi:MAG TPA: hypothetical protein VGO53_13030 [Steroidobacteraceae bacterium]|jgi:hypothetical protein|nr:hypothetical protein [Steroidobacteraceae bacterium]